MTDKIVTLPNSDGATFTQIGEDGRGLIRSRIVQPGRGAILESNRELRKNPDALIKNAEGLHFQYRMPRADMNTVVKQIRRLNPGIGSYDENRMFTKWLEQHGDQYKVRD